MPDEDRLGARLHDWAAQLRRGSLITLMATIGLMIGMALFYRHAAHAPATLRHLALLMVAGHSVAHALTIGMLRAALWKRARNAAEALAAYLDPLRIGHRDLAAAWVLYYVFVPRLVA